MLAGTMVAVLVSLVAAAPAAEAPVRPRRALVWDLGVALSAGIVYRMDTMPTMHKDGLEILEHARRTAVRLGTPLPDDPALRGPEVDTLAGLQYLQDPRQHPTAVQLAQRDGKASAGLFTLGALSHLAMMAITPSSEVAKDLADRLEAAALEAELPRATWIGLVDALRRGTSSDAVKDEMVAMLRAVARVTSAP